VADQNTTGRRGAATALTDRYEQLRAGVLPGTGDGLRFGLGVLAARGMAAWMTAWQTIPPAPTSAPLPAPASSPTTAPPGTGAADMVRVLAAMALAHV
jgi:hypothetical protein